MQDKRTDDRKNERKNHKENKQQHLPLSLNWFANEVCKDNIIFRIIRMDLEHEPTFHPSGDYQFNSNFFANCDDIECKHALIFKNNLLFN